MNLDLTVQTVFPNAATALTAQFAIFMMAHVPQGVSPAGRETLAKHVNDFNTNKLLPKYQNIFKHVKMKDILN